MIVLLMGTTGVGKTTIGTLLAAQMGWEFADGDQFHSPANIQKMQSGIPLDDADRLPWLDAIRAAMLRWNAENRSVVLACSALKRSYRERLAVPGLRIVYLKGSYDLVRDRLRLRHEHFATDKILAAQFADLQEPEDALTVEVGGSPEEIVAKIRSAIPETSVGAKPSSTH